MKILDMLLIGWALVAGLPQRAGAAPAVVVELFSSEGCSSCPRADAVLARLDSEQPVGGAEVLALEFHVDYWNDLGWADPFSSREFTQRQQGYAVLSSGRVYTPQMVVDGQAEFLGSDESAARAAIAGSSRGAKARVQLARKGGALWVTVSELPQAVQDAGVWLAITERGLHTSVPRGENRGRSLEHAPVVRELRALGALTGSTFTTTAEIRIGQGWKRENLRLVVFVQQWKSRRILGAAALPESA